MTTEASVWPQPLMPNRENVASSIGETSLKGCRSTRGYSNSLVPNCLASKENELESDNFAGLAINDRASSSTNHETGLLLPLHMKARQNLQLPSFKSLGIASRLPDALLTPPDESIFELGKPATLSHFSRSSSFPPSMPKTPSPDLTDFASEVGYTLTTSRAPSSTQPTMPTTEPEGNADEEDGTGPISSSSEDEEYLPEPPGWLTEAVEPVANSMEPDAMNNVINVLCHSQPCPLSNQTVETTSLPNTTSAFGSLLSAIQNKVDSTGCYIDIVHAVPIKFNMGQIPNSPATTPGTQNTAQHDYFNMNTFSKAVVAIGHNEALETSIPSSPRPVVPPASVAVSLLERFIPPSTAEEYLHLFANDAPSALANRLFELSPQKGSLIFIYPTSLGASTFASTYLGPLLHPLLRTMVSIHNLSMDFGAGVGNIPAVDQMLPFDRMVQKLNLLLRKLSRGTSTVQHRLAPNPRYTLVEKSSQVVQLDRKVWTEWWVQQESGRIRTVVERYLKRGSMMPVGKDVTAATLVQEVLDGVRSTRSYAEYDEAREGIEVGVFVIKRTA